MHLIETSLENVIANCEERLVKQKIACNANIDKLAQRVTDSKSSVETLRLEALVILQVNHKAVLDNVNCAEQAAIIWNKLQQTL